MNYIASKIGFVLVALFFISGCMQEAPETYAGPSGNSVSSVKCKGSPKECFVQANNICNGPYSVVYSESHLGGVFADLIPGPVTWYSMTFECGKSNGVQPTFSRTGGEWNPNVSQPTRLETTCRQIGHIMQCS